MGRLTFGGVVAYPGLLSSGKHARNLAHREARNHFGQDYQFKGIPRRLSLPVEVVILPTPRDTARVKLNG